MATSTGKVGQSDELRPPSRHPPPLLGGSWWWPRLILVHNDDAAPVADVIVIDPPRELLNPPWTGIVVKIMASVDGEEERPR